MCTYSRLGYYLFYLCQLLAGFSLSAETASDPKTVIGLTGLNPRSRRPYRRLGEAMSRRACGLNHAAGIALLVVSSSQRSGFRLICRTFD